MHIVGLFIASILSFFNFNHLAATSAAFFDTTNAPQATILFGGDMMFDRTIRTTVEREGGDYLFFCIDPTLAASDAVIANLEGPITDEPSISVGSKPGDAHNFTFTFPVATAKLLHDHHIDIVNMGNNHILNFGVAGLLSTQQALAMAGVAYFGQAAGESYVYRAEINDVPLEFINYNEFGGNASTTIAQIARAKKDGFVPIVYTHWGIEYEPTAPQYVRDLAHQFVDAGAAAVIGSHPHVVEDHETYGGAPIYYSLGNLIFDQYFTDAVSSGLLVKLTLDNTGVSNIQEIPVVLNRNGTVCPLPK